MIDTNLNGTWWMMQEAAKRWRADGRPGNIVNIVANVERGMPQAAHTCAARAGVIYLSKTLATEWAPHGIRVNCIGPGVIETEGFAVYPEEALARFHKANPMKQRGDAWDVAEAIVYLASPAARFINGDLIDHRRRAGAVGRGVAGRHARLFRRETAPPEPSDFDLQRLTGAADGSERRGGDRDGRRLGAGRGDGEDAGGGRREGHDLRPQRGGRRGAAAAEIGGRFAARRRVRRRSGAQTRSTTAEAAHGVARILVNCAGIVPAGKTVGRDGRAARA